MRRRLKPDPTISNQVAAERYVRIAAAGLLPPSGVDPGLAAVRARFDKFYPEDEYPHPCGLSATFQEIIVVFDVAKNPDAIVGALAQYVAFCPEIPPPNLRSAVDQWAVSNPPENLGDLVDAMFAAVR